MRGEGLNIPLSDDVDVHELAEKYDMFCGREIKNVVRNVCVRAAINERESITQADIIESCDKVKIEAEKVTNASDHTQSVLKEFLKKKADTHNRTHETKRFCSRPSVRHRV